MDPIAERNLQALPVEVLDMILLKVVTIPLLKKRAESNYNICPKIFDEEIKTLRTVWSEWNYRLTNRWFWIKLKRLNRLTLTRLQKRITLKCNVEAIAKLRHKICVLTWTPSSIRVYKDFENFALEKEIPLGKFWYCPTIEPSVKSNSVYVQYRYDMRYTIQKVNIDEDNALTIWLKDIKNALDPGITVTSSDNVFVLTNDRVCLYSAKAELLSCVGMMKEQSSLKPWKIILLPQGNFVIGCARIYHKRFMAVMGEIVCQGAEISDFVASEVAGMSLKDIYGHLWGKFACSMPSAPEFRFLSLDVKNRLVFLISQNLKSLLMFDTTSLSLVQCIPLRDECSVGEPIDPVVAVVGLWFDTEKRSLCVGDPWTGNIDVYKVY